MGFGLTVVLSALVHVAALWLLGRLLRLPVSRLQLMSCQFRNHDAAPSSLVWGRCTMGHPVRVSNGTATALVPSNYHSQHAPPLMRVGVQRYE